MAIHEKGIEQLEAQVEKQGSEETRKQLRRHRKGERRALTEIHKRRALAFSSLVFVLIGGPLGILTKRGKNLAGFGLALLVFLAVYYPLFIAGERLAEEGAVAPGLGLWCANGVVLALGAGLVVKVFRA